jgi:hypothetical protein
VPPPEPCAAVPLQGLPEGRPSGYPLLIAFGLISARTHAGMEVHKNRCQIVLFLSGQQRLSAPFCAVGGPQSMAPVMVRSADRGDAISGNASCVILTFLMRYRYYTIEQRIADQVHASWAH